MTADEVYFVDHSTWDCSRYEVTERGTGRLLGTVTRDRRRRRWDAYNVDGRWLGSQFGNRSKAVEALPPPPPIG